MNRLFVVGMIPLLVACSDTADDGSPRTDVSVIDEVAETGTDCPRLALQDAVDVRHAGDTRGLKNLVVSPRLGWGEAPDDAVAFTAPEAGTYEFATVAEPSGTGECGASVWDYRGESLYDESWCPKSGLPVEIDGFYATAAHPYELKAGQTVIVWFSCADGSEVSAGPYTITISKR